MAAFDTKSNRGGSRFVAPTAHRQRARQRRASRRRQSVRARWDAVYDGVVTFAAAVSHNVHEYTGIELKALRLPTLRRPRIEGALDDVMLSPRLLSPRAIWERLAGVPFFATPWHPSKLVSVVLLLWVAVGLWWTHSDDLWFVYREDVLFEQNAFVPANELYSLSGLEGWNLLWQRPDRVAAWIAQHPYVAGAQVKIGLPLTFGGSPQPPVRVLVQEETPTALWVTDAGLLWLLADGTALPAPRGVDVPTDLLHIIDGTQAARALDGSRAINPDVMASALALTEQMPSLRESDVRYSQQTGLNFVLPAGALPGQQVMVYWGDGEHAAEKLRNLKAMRQLIEEQGATAYLIDLRYLNRPYFR